MSTISSSIGSIGYHSLLPHCTNKPTLTLPSSFLGLHANLKSTTTCSSSKMKMKSKMSMEAGIGLMATKLGMMSFFEQEGKVVPVTVVGFKEGNIVTQVKTDVVLALTNQYPPYLVTKEIVEKQKEDNKEKMRRNQNN